MKVLKSLSVVISLLLIMTPALAFGQYSLNFIGFMPDPANPTTKTEVVINGEGFVSGDITGMDVSTNSSFSTAYSLESGFVVNENVMNTEDEIFGTISQPPETFSENDYYVKIHSTANGTVILGPIHFIPGGGGPQIWGGHFAPDGSQTMVEMFGNNIPDDLTSVTVGGYPVTSVVVEPDTMMPGDQIIRGIIAVDISTFSEGNYTVEFTSTSKGTFNFDVWFDVFIPGPPSGKGIWHFSMHPDMGYIEVYIETKDIPFDSIVSIEISLDQTFTTGSIYTVTSLEFEPGEGWEGSDFISGIINEAYKTFPSGDYYIRITMAAGDPYTWGTSQFPPEYVPTPPPLSEITFSKLLFIHYQPDTTAVIIYGEKFFRLEFETGVAIQLSDNASFTGNVYDFIIDDIEDEPSSRGFIVGLYPTVVTNFPAGDYYVKIIVPGESPILSGALTTPAGYIPDQPVIYPVGSIFRGYKPGRTGFGVPGDLFDTITITSIEIFDNSDFAAVLWTVDSIEVMPNEHGLVDEVKGVIHVDINDIPGGDYYVRINFSGGSIVGGPFLFTGWEEPPTAPDVIDLVFMGGGTGVTDLDIVGHGFDSGDITQVQVSRDGGFSGTGDPVYTLTSLNVLQGEGPEGADLITGTIPVDITALPEGDYYVKVLSMSSGEHIFGPFYYEAGGGTKPEFFRVGIGAEGLDASIDIQGENFDLFPPGAITSWRFTKDDSTFSGSTTIYEVTNITVEVNPDSDDRIFGIVTGLDPMTLEKGKYYAELTITGAPSPILIPFYFSPYGPPMFFNIVLFDEGTTTRVEMFGENLAQIDTADIYSMVLINDSTLANATIVWNITDYYIVSYPDSIEKIVGYISGLSLPTLPQGDYWISVSAQCLIDAGFPDPTVYPFYWYGGGEAPPEFVEVYWFWMGSLGNTLDRMQIGVGGKFGPNDITAIAISMDQTFSGGSPIYDVTEIGIKPEAGWENEDVANGFIEVGFNELELGSYFARVTTLSGEELTAGPFEFTRVEVDGFGLNPQTGGIVQINIRTRNVLSEEVTAAELSTDREFTGASPVYIVTDLKFIPATEPRYRDTFRGIIHESLMNIPPGEYFLKVYTSSVIGDKVNGPQTIPFGTWPPLSDVKINDFGILYYSVDTTEIVLKGDAFRAFRVYNSAVHISADPSFSGAVYDVNLVSQHRQFYGPWLQYGIIPVDVTEFTGGEYYARVITPGEPTLYSGAITVPAGFIPDQPVLYSAIDDILRSSSTQGVTNFLMKGDLLHQVTVEQVEVSSDPGFNPESVIYTVENVEKVIDIWGLTDIIRGTIPVEISDIPPGIYYVRVSIVEGDPLISGGFQHFGEPVEVEVYYFGFWPSSGKVGVEVEGANLVQASVTGMFVSMDDQFGAGSTIYPVTELYFESDDGLQEVDGIIDVNYIDFPHGDYYVKVTSPSGDVVFGPVTFPTEPMPPPISSVTVSGLCLLHLGADMTLALIEGTNFEAFSLVSDFTVEISDNAAFTGVVYTVSVLDIDSDVGPIFIVGVIDASVISFPAGNYYVRITVPGEPEIMSGALALPEGFIPTQPVIYTFGSLLGEYDEPGETRFCLFGDLLDLVTITQVEVSQDPTFEAGSVIYVVESIEVEVDGFGAIDFLDGVINVDISNIPAGNYYVRLILAEGGPIISGAFTFGGVEDAATEVEVFMIALVPGLKPGETELRIYGENFEYIQLAGLTFDVSQDSTFSGVTEPIYPVTGLRKVFKPGRDDLLTGRIEVDFKTLPLGMYYLRVTSDMEGVVDLRPFMHKGQPQIVFSPPFLDFGLVGIGERDSLEVTIRNDGNDTLRVFTPSTRGSSPSFYSTEYQLPEISPGDSVKNTIVFEPHYGATYRDTIWFVSNDLLRPFAPLFVRGKSTITDITPPVFIEFPRAVGIDTSSATIVFKTDEPTCAEVIYWEASYIGTEIITTGQQAIPDTHKVVIDSVFSMWHNITLTGLSSGTVYSFIVSITDILENSPAFSQASFFQTRALADIIPPVITKAPIFYLIDTSTVMINWYTDEIATSMIRYNPGDTLTAEEWNVIQPEFENMHEILLEGLTPDTIYSYQVGSEDVHGNGPTVSSIRHFYTLARPDIEPPNFIEQPQVIGVDTSNALIRFLTDEPSNTVIYYNVDSLFIQGIWLEYVDSLYVKWHRAVLSGLFPGVSYTFFAQTTDRNGNGPSESFHFNFKTKDMADTRPPVFLGFPTVIAKDTSSVTIGWVTDEISTSVIEYEVIENFDSTRIRIEDPTLTRDHIITITNLMPAAKYIFIIRSVDAHGNEAVINRTFGFMTALRIDREAPVIFGKPHVAEKDTDRVVIKWETNERATSIVEIAVDTLFENAETSGRTVITDLELTRFHSVSVFGLTPNTFYAFRVGSEDGFGNGPVYSEPQIVKTLDVPDMFPPVIFGFPEVRIVDTSTVAIRWKTNEISSRRVVYYAEGSEENVNIQEEQALSRDGVIILSDLIPATKYFFTVFSTDSKGNTSQKGPFEFTTPARADLIPPVFMKFPAIANIDTSSFVIEWVTDENANAILEYFPVDDPSDTLTVDDQTLQLRHSIYVSGLAPGTQYQVRVLSFDQAGNGPLTSEWFTIRTRNLPDLTPPRILGFPVVMKTDTSSATIAWLTDEPASSEVEYALVSQWSANNLMEMISEFSRTNEITLTNLLPDSLYFYRIRLTDRFGNVSEFSPQYRFRTLALADIIPPAFVGLVHITEIDTNKATIRWRTNEASNSIVEIGTAEEWPDNTWMVVEQELTENHAVLIKDLTSDTRYIIRVRSIDANENASEFSAELRFKTLATPDTRPPVILGQPTERDIDTTSVTIIFGTDEPATTRIEVREADDTTKTFLFLDGELVRLHRTFVSGLRSNTEYGYRVSAIDASNNGPTVSGYQRFRTLESADITPPRVTSGPIVIGLTHHSATIKFITNEVSYVSVSFGTNITLGTTVSELQGKTTHTIRLNNLADSTLYYYQLEGKDIKGNEFIYPPVEQERLSFRTKPMPAVQDVSKPKIIAGPVELDIEPYQMTILWQTDKLANSVVDFGTDTTLKETVTQDNETMVHRHRVRLTNLIADTTYFYRIKSRGANNIEFASNIFIVQTPALPDTLPAIIVQGPIVTFLGSDNATIEWLTDKNSSSRVDFGVDHVTLAKFIKENEIEGVKRHQIKLTGLFQDTIYYYQVSSIASNGREIVSNPFSFKTLTEVDSLPPKFLAGPDATAIENTSATIEWITDELSTSKVEYGLKTPGVLNLTEVVYVDADAAGVIKHKAVLTELTPGALYIFSVSSTDLSPARNEAVSRIKRFKTIAVQDIIPPRLLTGPIVDFTDRTAVFEWETDELSDSFVLIRKANTTDNFRKIGDERKVIKHIITVTNLNPGEEYEYEIASRDLAGNLMTWPTSNDGGTLQKFMELRKVAQPPGGGGSFSTDQDPDTLQPIIIEGPSVVAKTSNSITVQWKTDERSDSFVDYGFTTVYGSIKGEATDVTIHSITLTNLTASMVYNFRVYSTDVDNNGPAFSGNAAVSTEAEADNTPPKITAGPVIESITDDQATIIWETDELSDTYVEFGTTIEYGSVRISTEDVKVHSITLTNLSSATTYHFRVSSTDISDNGPTTNADTTFTTEASPDVILPVITNVAYSAVTDKTATITFTTDELADTFVDYGILSTTEFKVGNAQDVFEHEITLTNLMPDTTYQFTVGSLDKSDNHSAPSTDFSFKTAAAPDTEAPAAPAGFTGVEGNSQVLIMWNPNTEEDLAGYNIYRKAGDDTTLIATLVADTFYNDDGLTNGATYDYFISAADNQIPYNESSTTSIVSLTPDESNSPSTPAQFFPAEGQRIRYDAINMSVENSTPPEGRSLTYEFVIAEEEDFFNQIAFGENIAEGSTYTIWFSGQELTHNQTYYWKARAYDGYFYSVWSGARSFIADTTVTTNVTLVDFWGEDNEGVVVLGWLTSRETNNAGFNIYRSLTENDGFEKINTNLVNVQDRMYNYTDTNVEAGRYYYYRLESVSTIGFAEKLGTVAVEVTTPRAFKLYQNYPNPFNPNTTIKFELPRVERVRIKIYNILGQEVKELLDERKEAGYHLIMWDGRDKFERPVASGMYIYRIIAGEFVQAKKMLLIR